MSGIAVEYWYPMLQYTASHSAAAHIMNAVVSISMSPEIFSSGESTTGAGAERGAGAGAGGASFSDGSLVESSIIVVRSIMSQDAKIQVSKAHVRSEQSHDLDGRPRRLHLARRQARPMARSH